MITWTKREELPKTFTVVWKDKKGKEHSKEEPIVYLGYCSKNKSYHRTYWVESSQYWSMFTKDNPPQYLSELNPPLDEAAQ